MTTSELRTSMLRQIERFHELFAYTTSIAGLQVGPEAATTFHDKLLPLLAAMHESMLDLTAEVERLSQDDNDSFEVL